MGKALIIKNEPPRSVQISADDHGECESRTAAYKSALSFAQALFVILELQSPYEHVPVDISKEDQKREDVSSVNLSKKCLL